ncbi:MAG TPA: alpha/beta hydrolase-fold protein [Castellaniella sp.]|jgi:predicted alpha/beta superfamily hydrolase|nr:alpha/beta hydrolase-fold protein [Castellaniella sp.]
MSLRETVLDGGGDPHGRRRLRLRVPESAPPDGGWPLLVLLDGDWVWPLPPSSGLDACAILVPSHGPQGSDGPQALARRALDYTPPAPDGGRWPDPRMPGWQCGGADAFLDELLGPMLDWAGHQAALDRARLSLYGHSYGGLCALHALARRPAAFAQVICASPSLWWHEGLAAARLDALRDAPPPRPVRLTLMAGTEERWHPRPQTAAPRTGEDGTATLPALRALARRLAGIPRLACRLELLDGIGHGQALPASAQRAVALAAQ